jgi:hypothetical protein
MKFEHLIEVNDPFNPLIDTLSREQLWRGLVMRADSPKLFMPHLDECVIEERDSTGFRRRLRFGELVIVDRVVLDPLVQVRYEIAAQGDIAASSMTMTIEAPTNAVMNVRFNYDNGEPEPTDAATAMYDDFRRSAYEEADKDTIRIVRRLAAEGKLDGPVLN